MSISKHLIALKEAWKAESKRRKQSHQEHLDEEFLPAALEIAERPPSPIGRAIMWSIISSLVIALLWSIFGWVDIVAVGEGRAVPNGRLQSIEAAEAGTVRTINVKEGTKVKQGDPLITLDPTYAAADVGAAVAEFNQASLAAARANALLSYISGKSAEIIPPPNASPAAVNAEKEVVRSRINSLEEKLAGLRARELGAKSAISSARSSLARTRETLPLAQEQLDARAELDRRGFGARLVTLQAKERVVSLQYDAQTQIQDIQRSQAELNMIERERAQTIADFRAQAASELSEAETTAMSRREAATKAKERERQQILTAPLSGTIMEVAITTIGERVEAGAPLMTLVPDGQELEIDAMILNKDIGFVKEGQRAIVKLETYPFTRFGYLIGHVERVAADSVSDEKRGMVFPVTIKIDSAKLTRENTQDKKLNLTPGMTASVEISTGKRRIIDFILSPVAKATSEAGRER